MMVGTIILVAGFQTSTALANAYGLAVAMIMLLTSLMIALNMHYIWNWSPFIWVPLSAIFILLDGAMVSANCLKVPNGGWFSLTVAAIHGTQVEIAIIPHTYAATSLRTLSPGDALNIEVDVMGKYAERQSEKPDSFLLTEEYLIANGS